MNFDIEAIKNTILGPNDGQIDSGILQGTGTAQSTGGGISRPGSWSWGINTSEQLSPTNFVFNAIVIFIWAIGIIMVLTFIYAGFKYLTAGGDMEKAESGKKILTGSIVGMLIILASFVVFQFTVNVLNDPNRASTPAGRQQLMEHPPNATGTDSDRDGFPDTADRFPNDSTRH